MVKTKRGLPDMTYDPKQKLYRKRGTYKGLRYDKRARDPEGVLEKIEDFKAEVDGAVPVADMTVWSYIQAWYPARTAGLKPGTVVTVYDYPINKFINPHIGNLLMRDVKPLHIDGLMAKVAHMSASVNRKILLVLNQLFRSAIDNDVIYKNPCAGSGGSKRKAGGKRPAPKTPLTREQQAAFEKAVRGERVELFALLCMYAGLRREEALGLLWDNVHLGGASPHLDVRHTVVFGTKDHPIHSTDLKSKAAHRSIPIPPPLADALRRRRSEGNSIFVVPSSTTDGAMSKSAFRRLWQTVQGYSFPAAKRGEDGKPIKDGNGATIYEKKLQAGLVDFHVTPHLLRHTYITELCSSGLDVKKIQYLAGHETAQMTLDIYAKVVGNKPDELAPIINKHFAREPSLILSKTS